MRNHPLAVRYVQVMRYCLNKDVGFLAALL